MTDKLSRIIDESLDFSVGQYEKMVIQMKKYPRRQPRTIEKEKLKTVDSWCWTSGFYPASLWLLYEYSGEELFYHEAVKRSRLQKKQRRNRKTHDLGFMLFYPLREAYRITGDERYARILLEGAKSLSSRFNEKVGQIRSWDHGEWSYPVIIDNMMNLEYLFWASEYSGDTSFREIAIAHADGTMKNHFRDDFSCFHVVDYDPASGKVAGRGTCQGFSDSSAWSRGQAWAVYGYASMYRLTLDKKYLEQSVKAAEYILNHPSLPEDLIPYWDFDDTAIPDASRDASAAAILASGLYELQSFCDEEKGSYFMEKADAIICSLSSPAYRAESGSNENFILMKSVGALPLGKEIDVPLNYADYYYIEALLRRKGLLGGGKRKPLAGESIVTPEGAGDRAFWVDTLCRIGEPVLEALSQGELRKSMPLEYLRSGYPDRKEFSHLEAFGRLMAGMAPWLELEAGNTYKSEDPDEREKRKRFLDLYKSAVRQAVDPASPDFLNFCRKDQPLVDTAHFAQALVRAPESLFYSLDNVTRKNIIEALKSSRKIKPNMSNWLLFSAMVEAALYSFTGECRMEPVIFALKKHAEWYAGDGTYGDGAEFHWDYYNSFVIQPMLLEVTRIFKWKALPLDYGTVLKRARRYGAVLERLISPEGTYPPLGRSLPYRFGAFQLPSQLSLWHELPDGVSPAQMRSALTAVIRRIMAGPGIFDEKGWLKVGFYGAQLDLGEPYLSTGSMYLCTVGLIALGLPPSDPFWSDPSCDWTSKKIWSGQPVERDSALKD